MSLLAVALAIVIFSYLIIRSFHFRTDLSHEKVYSLSDQTTDILKLLEDEPIQITAFFRDDFPGKKLFEDLLKEYAYHHRNFKYHFFDPDRMPQKTREFQVDAYETIVVQAKNKIEKTRQATEESLTTLLAKLYRNEVKTIYFAVGHGGPSLNDADNPAGYHLLKEKLIESNYQVKEISLLRDVVSPDKIHLLVLGGPKVDLLPQELEILTAFLNEGGRLLILIDPVDPGEGQNMNQFLLGFGVSLGNNVIVDKLSKLFGADYLIPLVSDYKIHPITKSFQMTTFFPIARTVHAFNEKTLDLQITELAWTGAGSWAEHDLISLKEGKADFDNAEDIPGPVPIAVSVSHPDEEFRLVVVGDSDFVANRYLNLSGNRDFIQNICSWLAGDEFLMGGRASERTAAPLFLKEVDQQFIFYVPVLGLPIFCFIIGSSVFFWRRRYN
jgi:ABC-type uncharacterized transport system involved in gliding motility auxiliary subunit